MAKLLFIQDLLYEYMGVMAISAFLKRRGHKVEILIDDEDDDILDRIADYQPDVIAFSCLTSTHKWALEWATRIKARYDFPIILGGAHVTINPETVFPHPCIDAACIGEGEDAVLEYVEAIAAGENPSRIANLHVRYRGEITKNDIRPLIGDLDLLPFPDHDLYGKYGKIRIRETKPVLLGRGCKHQCTYCHNYFKMRLYAKKGRYVRIKSVERTIREIRELKATYPTMKRVHFIDDAFGDQQDWLQEFLPRFKDEIGLKYLAAIRVDNLDDEICRMFVDTGLDYTGFGLECGNEDLRLNLLKKRVTNEQIRRGAALLRKHKITFVTMNMIGLPGETLEQSFETLRLNIEIKADWGCAFIYQPYNKTQLSDYAIEHSFLDASALEDLPYSFYDRSILNQPDIDAQVKLVRLFSAAVKHPRLLPWVEKAVHWPIGWLYKGIFSVYYLYYLIRYYELTPRMIFQFFTTWLKFQKK